MHLLQDLTQNICLLFWRHSFLSSGFATYQYLGSSLCIKLNHMLHCLHGLLLIPLSLFLLTSSPNRIFNELGRKLHRSIRTILSIYHLWLGILGYLILFTLVAFVSQCQCWPNLVFLWLVFVGPTHAIQLLKDCSRYTLYWAFLTFAAILKNYN